MKSSAHNLSPLVLAVAILAGPRAFAQEPCADDHEAWPYLGVAAFVCPGGSCGPRSLGGRAAELRPGPNVAYDFATEPRLYGIAGDGPAASRIEEGDVLVAVNGYFITSVSGGRELASLPPGRAAALTLRRGDRLVQVDVVPEQRCEPAVTASGLSVLLGGGEDSSLSRMAGRGSVGLGLECDGCRFNLGANPIWSGRAAERRVVQVQPQSRAETAGLRPGDRLIAVDGHSLRSKAGNELLFDAILGRHPEDRVLAIRYRREGQELETSLTVPGRAGLPTAGDVAQALEGLDALSRLGRLFSLGPILRREETPSEITVSGSSWGSNHLGMVMSWCDECSWALGKNHFRWTLTEEPEITEVVADGPAASAGLEPGDVITHINGHEIRSDEAGRLLVLSNQEGTRLTIAYRRGATLGETVLVTG